MARKATSSHYLVAAGEVIGFPALASISMEQARHAVLCAFRPISLGRSSRLLPTEAYTIPEVSMIGETEESLRSAGVDISSVTVRIMKVRAGASSEIPTAS